jgi:hypothetical protein
MNAAITVRSLLTLPSGQAKMAKSAKSGVYLPYIMHLSPSDESGFNTCPMATDGCRSGCLTTTFRMADSKSVRARIARTHLFFKERARFFDQLISEISKAERKANREGKKLIMRLNGTSDIRWEIYKAIDNRTIFEVFPNVTFYDYTKIPNRKIDGIPNYSLTFSRAEKNHHHTQRAIDNGFNVAAVFRNAIPSTWNGLPVIDGDLHDLRIEDPKGVIIGLKAKGKAKYDRTGFVID